MTKEFESIKLPAGYDLDEILSIEDLARLGLNEIAYVRPVVDDGEEGFGIFSADGQPLGFAPEIGAAFAAVVASDMVPLTVQ